MKFREILKEKGYTQTKLANELGKSQKLISNWCNGICEPQIKDLLKLKDILKIDLYKLLICFTKK